MKDFIITLPVFIISIIMPAVRMTNVFVYGTLKKGQPNYHELQDSANGQADFITRARTIDPYPLVIAGKNNIPFLLNVPGSGQQVHGEIYCVDQKMLDFLDEFEECPKMYQRTLIQLEILKEDGEPGGVQEAFIYSTTKYESDWLNKPTYASYDAYGDHGLRYNYENDRSENEQLNIVLNARQTNTQLKH